MYEGKKVGALILMGGIGNRFGSEIPKQFHPLQGKPLYQYTLEVFQNCGYCDEIILVCHPNWIEEVQRQTPQIKTISGGATRQNSSYQGLLAFDFSPEIVMIHDAVRPFVSKSILQSNLELALKHGAANTCIPTADTLVYAPQLKQIQTIPKREEYLRGQTPQTFLYDWILDAHKKAEEKGTQNASDDCRLVLEAGYPVQIAEGSESNLKITTAFDLYLAQFLIDCAKQV